ncbi:MAG: LD-carboxypeptidase [Butyrivibrio sp.]|nr:LD-carboxypeptidase [Butyrivibrio sp.]
MSKKTMAVAMITAFTMLVTACGSQKPEQQEQEMQQEKIAAESAESEILTEGEDTKCEVSFGTYTGENKNLFLKSGDKIAVISPSALPSREQTDAVINGLKEWGYEPVEGKHVCAETRTLDDIKEDLEWALENPEIKAIFCVRGGYGATEVADDLSAELIKQGHKLIIGYSDITVYHSAWTANGIASIHSCMSGTFSGLPESCFEAEEKILKGEIPSYTCESSVNCQQGEATGILIGGNLATFTAVIDSAYDCTKMGEPYILFLEDVGENIQHIHRYLTVLKHAGVLENAAGIVFGEWAELPQDMGDYSGSSRGGAYGSVADMISRQFLPDLNVPVAFGFPAGHGDINYPLLMGEKARLKVEANKFELDFAVAGTEQMTENSAKTDNIVQFPNLASDKNIRTTLSRDGYTLEQAVVLSRHNIRAPLSGAGSALDTITPHEWFNWSSEASQLSVRGGTLETEMGQYFRKWLESENLFEANYQPKDGSVRIYANSKQRTIATARFFTAGLLPAYNAETEYHCEFDTMDPVFSPVFTYVSDDYTEVAEAEIHRLYDAAIEGLADNYALLEEVIDAKESEDYKKGDFAGFVTGDSTFSFEEGKEPTVAGSLKKACQVSDALVLQYYEEPDSEKAAFGHSLSDEDWEAISEIKDVYGDVLFTAPSVAINVAHPLLQEMEKELLTEGRQFTFLCGHDANIGSVLASLDVEDYSLPYAIEKKTPIGSKLVISRWKDSAGEEYISLDMVYQKTEQLRNMSLLGIDNPPAIYSLRLKGLNADTNGLYKASDIMGRLSEAISAYDRLMEENAQEEAA